MARISTKIGWNCIPGTEGSNFQASEFEAEQELKQKVQNPTPNPLSPPESFACTSRAQTGEARRVSHASRSPCASGAKTGEPRRANLGKESERASLAVATHRQSWKNVAAATDPRHNGHDARKSNDDRVTCRLCPPSVVQLLSGRHTWGVYKGGFLSAQ